VKIYLHTRGESILGVGRQILEENSDLGGRVLLFASARAPSGRPGAPAQGRRRLSLEKPSSQNSQG
jgi:hypothetical protein